MVTARLYKQSGFNLLNIPDSEATLEASAGYIDVPAMDILQVMHNTHITIRAKESQVSDADFMKLTKVDDTIAHPTMTAFYAINSYTMTSGDVVDLNVSMEPILTAGGFDNFADYIEGTVTRHHLHKYTPTPDQPGQTLTNDQKIYKCMQQTGMESDPYLVPSFPAKMKFVEHLFWPGYARGAGGWDEAKFPYALVVFSSIPVDSGANFKYDIGDPTSGDGLIAEISNYDGTIPIVEMSLKSIYDDGYYSTYDHEGAYWNSPSSYTDYLTLIENIADMKRFKGNLARLAANNLTGIITQCYYVPMLWFSYGGGGENPWLPIIGGFTDATFRSPQNHFSGSPIYTNTDIKNKMLTGFSAGKCSMQPLMGDNNQITFIATKTGDTKSFKPEDIIQPKGEVLAKGTPDPRPNGGIKFAIKQYGADDYDYGSAPRGHFSNIIEGGSWTKTSVNSIGQTGYNVNRQLFNAQQQSKDTLADYASMAGIQSYKNTSDPISWATNMIKSALEQNTLSNLINGGTKDQYSSGFSAEISGFNGIDYTEGILAGNERLMGLANREVEKKAELAQFGASNAPQPIAVGSPSSDELDVMSYTLLMFKRELDERDIDKFIKIQSRFGVRHTTLFDKDFIDNHMNFNYIEMTGANVYQIGTGSSSSVLNSKMLRQAVADALNTGIRIWHKKPTTSDHNPYKEGN